MKKVKKLSDVEMKFIDLNWEEMTQELIAVKLTVSVSLVQYYCRENGYTKPKTPIVKPPKEKISKNPGPERKSIKRPPAIYSNESREQRIDRWINTEIPAPKGKRIGYNSQKKTA